MKDKKLNIKNTELSGLHTIELDPFIDERGSFTRLYCFNELKELLGTDIKQINHSVTKEKGTVRGFHFQYEPNTEVKIIKCIKGSVFDVVIDVRKYSKTFLQSYSIKLTASNNKMLYIPKGFAHGFQTLEDDTELLYMHSTVYTPTNEGALSILDPKLNVVWPLPIINLSERDKAHSFINNEFEGIQ